MLKEAINNWKSLNSLERWGVIGKTLEMSLLICVAVYDIADINAEVRELQSRNKNNS